MNRIERRLFATDDWLSRHPRLIALLLLVLYVLACSVEVMP